MNFDAVFPLRCASAQRHQTIRAVKSYPRALGGIPNLIYTYSISHSLRYAWNVSLVASLHGCTIAFALKQPFAQCKIFLEETLLRCKTLFTVIAVQPWKKSYLNSQALALAVVDRSSGARHGDSPANLSVEATRVRLVHPSLGKAR